MRTEKRKGERIDASALVTLVLPAGEVAATSRNIGLRGMFVVTDVIVPVGSSFQVRFRLASLHESTVADVTVRWRESNGIGLQFVELRPLDEWGLHQLLKEKR